MSLPIPALAALAELPGVHPGQLVGSATATLAVRLNGLLPAGLPGDVDVTPNSKLPGTTELNTLLGGMVTWVLLACVAAILIGAASWGIGNRSGYYGATQNGRMMVLGGSVGAMVAGAASALVNYGFGLGSAVH
jgi:hypothetical protein